jgi:hypothetical protein
MKIIDIFKNVLPDTSKHPSAWKPKHVRAFNTWQNKPLEELPWEEEEDKNNDPPR